jgi:hypothetical protein
MQAHIFAEGSNTTTENRDQPVKEYYQGLFNIIENLHEDLSNLTDSHLHILSEEYGVASGEEKMSDVFAGKQTPIGKDNMAKEAREELLNAADDADVMVILLSTEVFELAVVDVWDELVATAKSDSIWCIGAARSSLDALDFKKLEAKDCTVLTYQRVGVARIGSETRDELIERVKQKATQ